MEFQVVIIRKNGEVSTGKLSWYRIWNCAGDLLMTATIKDSQVRIYTAILRDLDWEYH